MTASRDFKSCLKQGQVGEVQLLEMWPELTRLDGRAGDFITPDFETVELKTDSYTLEATENLFIEWTSDLARNKPGGPRQAFARGCTLFAYLYVNSGTCFVYKTHQLMKAVSEMNLKPVRIQNKSWVTIGFKVPRQAVAHLVIKELKNASKD